MERKELYLPDTNILIAHVLRADGVGEIIDFMPTKKTYFLDPFATNEHLVTHHTGAQSSS
jgi:hypothetical protein